jgi:catechol 2,3-dioxygenase-like lactoylglutathione lyase family enzyme
MTRPTIPSISPFFIVADVPATLAFYRDKLGSELMSRGPTPEDDFFGILGRDGATIMFKAPRDHARTDFLVVVEMSLTSEVQAALIGALIAGVLTLAGSFVTVYFETRRAREDNRRRDSEWRREKCNEAYSELGALSEPRFR